MPALGNCRRTDLACKAASLLFAACLSACSLFEPEPATAGFTTMGTRASVTVPGRDSGQIQQAEKCTKGVMNRLEAEMSVYRPDSALSRLNRLAGKEPSDMPPDTVRLLAIARDYGRLTGGAFDVTVGPLVQLWHFGKGRPPSVPSEEALAERRALVHYADIQLNGQTAFLPRTGMSVDLGGIAKGYAVDVAWEECRKAGLRSFLIDLGGNIRVSGEASRGIDWKVDVRNPFDTSTTLGRLDLGSGWAVASSGQYERFVEIEGRRYGHILDPRTGYPAAGLAGVTVIARDATTADALSTALFVLGPRDSVPVLRKTKAEALFIPDKEPVELWVTPGLEGRLIPSGKSRIRRLPGW